MTLDDFNAQCEADEAEMLRLMEWKTIDKNLSAAYRARYAGDNSVLTATRIDRLERLQQAFLGAPQALAG
ncbi:hypothetical protein ABZ235_09830 [Streptomyces canus]|uniref:hypothetical protein n=1 Tax=Streptomyces canus TaxID=58343 RepID=UPI0033BEBD4A